MTNLGKIARSFGVCALLGAAAIPATLAAQGVPGGFPGTTSTQTSFLPNYHLLQLSVDADKVSPKEFETRTKAIQSCADGRQLARELKADLKRNRFVRASSMPSAFHDLIKDVPSGSSSAVFTGGGSEAMRVFVVCNRS